MRFLIAVLAFTLIALPAAAMSLTDFNAKPAPERTAYVTDFIDKMTTDLRAKNPEMAQQIRAWFARKQDGKPLSEGIERLYAELIALENLGHEGKVDLSKVQVEGVIVKVVKDKFPPPVAQAAKP
jgi:hypothetical protein